MNSRVKDIEQSDQEEETLDLLIEENVGHEENLWPGMNIEDMSLLHLVCFFCNLIVVPTGFTFHLERLETRDSLICHRWIRERAQRLLHTIDRTTAKMGSGKSKQDNEGATIESQVGVDMETSYSLLDFCNWHSSSIGILIILIIMILGTLYCARRQYLRLHQEVLLHRGRCNLKEKGHVLKVSNSNKQMPRGEFPALQLTDTIVNKESLQRLRLAAAAGRSNQVD